MSGENQGPDLFFAGGECLTRFGVWLRRTDMDLEAATRELATRNSDATAIGRDGILRTWSSDTPRAEWLNEVDLDPTRNVLEQSEFIGQPGSGWAQSGVAGWERKGDAEEISDLSDQFFARWEATLPSELTTDYILSVDMKKDRASSIPSLGIFNGVWNTVVFDLATGDFVIGEGAPVITSLDMGGWWRVTLQVFNNTSGDVGARLAAAYRFNGDLGPTNQPSAEGVNLFRHIQLEKATTPTNYQQTPRDFDRKFPALLLEDAATNAFTFSEEFDNAVWGRTRSTISINTTIAPDGELTAETLTEDNTAAATHNTARDVNGTADDTQQSFSVFVKAAGRHEIRLTYTNKANFDIQAFFNLETGLVGSESSPGVGRMFALPDGWFRCELTGDSSSTATQERFIIFLSDGNEDVGYDGDGVSGVVLWGAELNIDAPQSSSYIATGGATASRQEDFFSTAFPHPPQENTFYVKFQESGSIFGTSRIFQLGDAPRLRITVSSANYVFQHLNGDGTTVTTPALVGRAVVGDLVELVGAVHADGSIQLTQVLNGGTPEVGTVTASNPFGALWLPPVLAINSTLSGSNAGFVRGLAYKAHRGVHGLDFMRAL